MHSGKSFRVDEDFLFIGRTFEEYLGMFGLEVGDLNGSRVLDCPGGLGAFTAVASTLGADVTAVDPEYGPSADELEPECEAAVKHNVAQLREKRDLFAWDYYGDVETRGRYQRAACERVLADYRKTETVTSRRSYLTYPSLMASSISPSRRTSSFCTTTAWTTSSTSRRYAS